MTKCLELVVNLYGGWSHVWAPTPWADVTRGRVGQNSGLAWRADTPTEGPTTIYRSGRNVGKTTIKNILSFLVSKECELTFRRLKPWWGASKVHRLKQLVVEQWTCFGWPQVVSSGRADRRVVTAGEASWAKSQFERAGRTIVGLQVWLQARWAHTEASGRLR